MIAMMTSNSISVKPRAVRVVPVFACIVFVLPGLVGTRWFAAGKFGMAVKHLTLSSRYRVCNTDIAVRAEFLLMWSGSLGDRSCGEVLPDGSESGELGHSYGGSSLAGARPSDGAKFSRSRLR